jgi:hypothetical protein
VGAEAITHEYAEAFTDCCTKFTSLTEQVRGGQDLSLDQMDEPEAAKLRLENARTLCELYVGGGGDPAKVRGTESRIRVRA